MNLVRGDDSELPLKLLRNATVQVRYLLYLCIKHVCHGQYSCKHTATFGGNKLMK